jgi:hypothetical protein
LLDSIFPDKIKASSLGCDNHQEIFYLLNQAISLIFPIVLIASIQAVDFFLFKVGSIISKALSVIVEDLNDLLIE